MITDLDTGGAEMMLARLVACMDSRIENSVISLTTLGPVAERISACGIPVFAVGFRRDGFNVRAFHRLWVLIRRLKPDLLQTWLYHADFMGLVAGRLSKVPNIVWNIRCSRLDSSDHPRVLVPIRRLLALMSGWPAAVVCNSEEGRIAHEELGYTPKRWVILPNGFDTAAFRPSDAAGADLRRDLGIGLDVKIVGMLARYHPMKDYDTFLRSAALVTAARQDVHFVAAGRGVDRNSRLREMIMKAGLESRVTLRPETAAPSAFLAGLDLAVSASYSEAFPNVIGESMACGIPCVATDVGESAALVGDTGAIVPPSNPAAMAEALVQLLALTDSARRALGMAARQRIVDQFSIDRVAARYVQLYLQLTSRTSAADVPVCAE